MDIITNGQVQDIEIESNHSHKIIILKIWWDAIKCTVTLGYLSACPYMLDINTII